jgi:hypothetical protein
MDGVSVVIQTGGTPLEAQAIYTHATKLLGSTSRCITLFVWLRRLLDVRALLAPSFNHYTIPLDTSLACSILPCFCFLKKCY